MQRAAPTSGAAPTPAPVIPTAVPSTQRRAVLTALVANLLVAGAKLGAFALTASSALLAESLHSFADTANEVLLLVGARRSTRPADLRHPFGHARYRYVYAFLDRRRARGHRGPCPPGQ